MNDSAERYEVTIRSGPPGGADSVTYRFKTLKDDGLLREAWDAVEEQVDKWGWFDDDQDPASGIHALYPT